MRYLTLVLVSLFLVSCTGDTTNVKPVSDFELDRYLGEWYEIARLDHWFERDLEQVTAIYSLNDNGTIKVINKGYLAKENKWKEAEGKAKFGGDPSNGFLKVSFFGPFYGPYVIYELDKINYQYAFVTSGKGYLWLLARSPSAPDGLMQEFIKSAQKLGYEKEELIFVKQK